MKAKKAYKNIHLLWICLMVLLGVVLVVGLKQYYCWFTGTEYPFKDFLNSNPWTLVTGLAAVPALLLTWYWRQNNRREDLEIARDAQLTDRFATAVKLLGDPSMEVRLGGIYALERISRNSPDDHWSVVETLAAFIRENAPIRKKSHPVSHPFNLGSEALPKPEERVKPRTDIQAALTVLGRRWHTEDETPDQIIDLSYTDLSGADLRKTTFKKAIFIGSNLEKAEMSAANLRKADFSESSLKKAKLFDCKLFNAKLEYVNFKDASLQHANLAASLIIGSYFQGTDLYDVDLQASILFGSNFEGCSHLKFAKLDGARFSVTDKVYPRTIFPQGFDPDEQNMKRGD